MSNALGPIFLTFMFMVGCECPGAGTGPKGNQAPTLADTNFTVEEDISDAHVIGTLAGRDEDRDPFTYFVSGDGGLFEVSRSSGQITLVAGTNLDFETTNKHVFIVGVTDGEDSNTAQVTITVIGMEDEDPVVTTGQSFPVDEHVPIGTSLGTVEATDDIGVTQYRITGGNTSEAFAINETNGLLTTAGYINYEGISSYQLIIEAQDEAGRSGTGTVEVIVGNLPFSLTNVENILDDDGLFLNSPRNLTTATVGGNAYLFVDGYNKFPTGMSVFSIGSDGSSMNVTNVNSRSDTNLYLHFEDIELTTVAVGGTTYLFTASSYARAGVSVFSVSSSGALINITNVGDNSTLHLFGTEAISTALIDSTSYLFVPGDAMIGGPSGVSVFSVGGDGSLSHVTNVRDTSILGLGNLTTIGEVGGTTYLFAGNGVRDVISVFSVGGDGSLSHVTNVRDNSTLNLGGLSSMTTGRVGGTTYLFVAGNENNGVSVFSVGSGGSLDNVVNVSSSEPIEDGPFLFKPVFVTTAEIGDTTYLLVLGNPFRNGKRGDGLSLFSVGRDGSLSNVANVGENDSPDFELNGPTEASYQLIGGIPYLFVSGDIDDGVSVFRVDD